MANRLSPDTTSSHGLSHRVAAGAALIGPPVGLAFLSPTFAEVMAGTEIGVIVVVLLAAVFGREALSERAFRLLRLLFNRPEPPQPRKPPTAAGRRGGSSPAGSPRPRRPAR